MKKDRVKIHLFSIKLMIHNLSWAWVQALIWFDNDSIRKQLGKIYDNIVYDNLNRLK